MILKDDLLSGVRDIAAYTGISEPALYYAISEDRLPVFRIGEKIFARKTTLLRWIEAQEAASASPLKAAA